MKGRGVTVIAGTAVYTGTVQAVVVRVRQVLALVTQVTGTAESMGPYNTWNKPIKTLSFLYKIYSDSTNNYTEFYFDSNKVKKFLIAAGFLKPLK